MTSGCPRLGNSASVRHSHLSFYFSLVAGDTMPLSVRHLDPSVGPALVPVNLCAIAIDAFSRPRASGNGSIAIESHFHVTDLVMFPFSALEVGQKPIFAVGLATGIGVDKSRG